MWLHCNCIFLFFLSLWQSPKLQEMPLHYTPGTYNYINSFSSLSLRSKASSASSCIPLQLQSDWICISWNSSFLSRLLFSAFLPLLLQLDYYTYWHHHYLKCIILFMGVRIPFPDWSRPKWDPKRKYSRYTWLWFRSHSSFSSLFQLSSWSSAPFHSPEPRRYPTNQPWHIGSLWSTILYGWNGRYGHGAILSLSRTSFGLSLLLPSSNRTGMHSCCKALIVSAPLRITSSSEVQVPRHYNCTKNPAKDPRRRGREGGITWFLFCHSCCFFYCLHSPRAGSGWMKERRLNPL